MGGYLNLGFYADQFSITAFAAKTDNTVRGGKQRIIIGATYITTCLLYKYPSPRDVEESPLQA